ncbi:ribosome small subunit-dependent GTPase A [Desulfarculus baarsii DSM 2075]|uniref:Small ribosomal subunit biogenesis GTPase RsgA n=1 Tax=Desulfarculus baarsii (strain ATCC 33931 / DSM 2075 / LMG 7858 / VKM B-1802 / 2st14) TaxID=644282 RepID=E1QGZ7_DESB2|nr:ribosome small subunit-dependent GTPase A [Desulfarculus baarsii]ADK84840.1 ribosome small subunit-dependent GTPase A [Desulfarculus baarsii DSM 2075]
MKIESYPDTSSSIEHLTRMGWNAHFQARAESLAGDGASPARVVGVSKNSFRLGDGQSEWLASLAGRLKHEADGARPVTGDWVMARDSLISGVLERQNVLSRGASGARGSQNARPRHEQVIAANLDAVFIVCGLDRDYNPRRLERYLTLVYNCGLNPVIVLTKADLHDDPTLFVGEVEELALGVPIHLVSAADDDGLVALAPYLSPGRTVTMVGSSGAGKSTLVNRLFGRAVQLTGAISNHVGKGKHTTTSRDLIVMPQGGMLIDNPGIREIAFWEVDSGVESVFPEIEKLALGCRFADCSHINEPGCRVLEAVASGELAEGRLENYRKMKREMEYLAQRQHKSAERVEKERWKDVALQVKALKKRR